MGFVALRLDESPYWASLGLPTFAPSQRVELGCLPLLIHTHMIWLWIKTRIPWSYLGGWSIMSAISPFLAATRNNGDLFVRSNPSIPMDVRIPDPPVHTA